MSKQRIYAGMICQGAEFWEDTETRVLWLSHNRKQYAWPNFPDHILQIVEDAIEEDPQMMIYLSGEVDPVRKFITCRFGSLSISPDIDRFGNLGDSDYHDCGLRGQCHLEGKLCCSLKAQNGVLSKSELEVLKYIRMPDKHIAMILNRSTETIASHMQNIRAKTGLSDKANLVVFAIEKGIQLHNPSKISFNGNHKNRQAAVSCGAY